METATLWHHVLNDPQPQELPYKIETNEHGQIVLSPQKPRHGVLQARIGDLLRDHAPRPGTRAVEFAVETAKGGKEPDVIWITDDRFAQVSEEVKASPVMPEIVVEVLSGSNTETEIAEKRRLYFVEGAEEVWTCTDEGRMRFFDETGESEHSTLVPSFPIRVD